jgi:quercetin dioxygenase-like cupin family protein
MKTYITTAFIAFSLLFQVAPAMAGNSPAKGTAPAVTKAFQQVLKTNSLRIMTLDLAPGEFLDFHATPDQEAYAASEGTLRVVTSDGQEKMIQVKAGDRLWIDLTHYKNWNAGESSLKIMLLEQPEALLEKKSK